MVFMLNMVYSECLSDIYGKYGILYTVNVCLIFMVNMVYSECLSDIYGKYSIQ